eukprot:569475-Pelagomonas_calceolata.AAC.4
MTASSFVVAVVVHARFGEAILVAVSMHLRTMPALQAGAHGNALRTMISNACNHAHSNTHDRTHRNAPGTMISNARNMDDVLVTSIVLKNQVTLVDIISLRMMGQYGFLATVFDAFGKHKLSVDVVATSEVGAHGTIAIQTQKAKWQRLLRAHVYHYASASASAIAFGACASVNLRLRLCLRLPISWVPVHQLLRASVSIIFGAYASVTLHLCLPLPSMPVH